ncbi:putative lipoprotein [Euzebya pacifica]|uniref:Putative lipoprotein n=2 Tax=Euzebya pacifica TaxID=1608957 RepID=A0A346XX62_9ACTN|nr:putative lipoprotein [Euzebya pacifica]
MLKLRTLLLVMVLAVVAAACAADDSSEETATGASETATEAAMDEEMTEEATAADSSTICDADGLVTAVESGAEEGTLAGMADDPVATAASSNPVLTTLVTAVSEAGLVDTLNSAEALTVFAPTDCAFANFDQATLEAALADPTGLLTQVLGFHVIAGEQIASADLSGDYETFTGETITIDGTSVAGQAEIVVPDIETANATVHLIDTVLVPPSVSGAAGDEAMTDEAMTEEGTDAAAAADSSTVCDTDAIVAAVQGGQSEGTLEGMADDPVATAASSNPVLTTLVTAVGAAGLGDTLNSAEALTVFAPTDCAFAALDEATLQAALDDPSGLLTQVLGLHVIVGERIASADLSGDYETFTGETITIDGTTVAGQAEIVVPDVQTANATVHLIDSVLLPSS